MGKYVSLHCESVKESIKTFNLIFLNAVYNVVTSTAQTDYT